MSFSGDEILLERVREINNRSDLAKEVNSYPPITLVENGEIPERTKK